MRILLLCFFASLSALYGGETNFEVVVQHTPKIMVSTGGGDCEATELWLINKKTNHKEFLLRGRENQDLKKTIAEIHGPVFSLNKRSVYFVSAAYMTSGSIQKIDLKSKKTQFLIDGNSVEVIPNGKYKGMLLVDRSLLKLDKHGETLGRRDYSWVVAANGKPKFEIGLCDGLEDKKFRSAYMRKSTPKSRTRHGWQPAAPPSWRTIYEVWLSIL